MKTIRCMNKIDPNGLKLLDGRYEYGEDVTEEDGSAWLDWLKPRKGNSGA